MNSDAPDEDPQLEPELIECKRRVEAEFPPVDKNSRPPTRADFQDTSVGDVQNLAQALLDDANTGVAIGRVKLHGDLTDAEEQSVGQVINAYAASQGWGPRDWISLMLPLALARRVAEGEIASVFSEDAKTFLRQRLAYGDYGNFTGQPPKMPFDDFFRISQDLMADKEYMHWLNEYRRNYKTEERRLCILHYKLHGEIENKYKKKYGVRGAKTFWFFYFIIQFLHGDLPLDDREKLRAHMSAHWHRFERDILELTQWLTV